jgi:hypothetical protein
LVLISQLLVPPLSPHPPALGWLDLVFQFLAQKPPQASGNIHLKITHMKICIVQMSLISSPSYWGHFTTSSHAQRQYLFTTV